ncbi:MAG: hypothetical protein DBY41_05985 [Clostridium sp.]|nr:hypothetical protein [Agathobacter rectalis]PWM80292.1 MAG: hypothetical protein DBY41_05985 [Clostridium sp.]
MRKRNLWICDTPLQTMNCLNYVYHTRNSDIENDLCIVGQFMEAQTICTRIKSKNLFNNVYFLNPDNRGKNESNLHWYIWRMYSYLFPKKEIEKCMKPCTKELIGYDCIWSSVVTCLVAAVLQENKYADFRLFDDGIGSYTGNIIENAIGWKHRLFSLIFRKGSNRVSPSLLYVNNPNYCNSTSAKKIEKLPEWDKDYLNFANSIFGYDNTDIAQKIVLLTQPNDSGKSAKKFDVVKYLQQFSDHVIVRPHPRDRNLTRYKGFVIDESKCLWEMRIANIDIENKVLISDFSTAQITPKMLFDKEPILIFTEYLNQEEKGTINPESIEMIENIKKNYRDKKRIIVPKTYGAFEDIVRSVVSQ